MYTLCTRRSLLRWNNEISDIAFMWLESNQGQLPNAPAPANYNIALRFHAVQIRAKEKNTLKFCGPEEKLVIL
jgi:hypothetical protein